MQKMAMEFFETPEDKFFGFTLHGVNNKKLMLL